MLTGVYDATAEASLLGMRHVVQAALREYQKMGRRPPTGVVSGSPGHVLLSSLANSRGLRDCRARGTGQPCEGEP